MGGERYSYRHRSQDCHQYGGRSAILDDPDSRVNVGMQMIRQVFHRGIEQLGRYYSGARQQHQSPPHRPRSQDQHRHHHEDEDAYLDSDAVLGAYGVPESREGEAQAQKE
jgi:hypothetical protein